jgi:DNA-binding FadR family transcriptional regulator
MISNIEKQTATTQVIDYVEKKIIMGEWKKGMKIFTEPILSKETGVGRPAVREAISILCALGVLVKRQGDGTYVANKSSEPFFNKLVSIALFDGYDVIELLELRQILEPACVKKFAQNHSPSELKNLEDCLEIMKNNQLSSVNEKFAIADLDFHYIIGLGTNNSLISKIMNILRTMLGAYQDYSNRIIGPKSGVIEHEQILNAIKANDGELAALLMRRHLERTEHDIEKYLSLHNEGTLIK